MIRVVLITFLILIVSSSTCSAKHTYLEKEYQKKWCAENNGISEVVLDSGDRVDCVTDKQAVEVEFAKKFYEAIGQSLFYSIKLNKEPAILLILETKKDNKYLQKLNVVADKFFIKVYTIGKEDLGG